MNAQDIKDDNATELAVRITNALVDAGFVADCTDTDDESEFQVQDIIKAILMANR